MNHQKIISFFNFSITCFLKSTSCLHEPSISNLLVHLYNEVVEL